MTIASLIGRTLGFYRRANAGVVLGCTLATAILAGALLVGDSVRESLRAMALARLGKIETGFYTGDRFFRDALADSLSAPLGGTVAPGLQVIGAAANQDRSARANQVQITGVDGRFWSLALHPPPLPPAFTNGIAVNERLAGQLHLSPGATLLLRLPKPSQLSRDAPIAPDEDFSLAFNLPVAAVVKDEEFGRFGLQADQVPPYNIFLPLALLQSKLNLAGRANSLLAGNCAPAHRPGAKGLCADPRLADRVLRQVWQLEDAGLSLRTLTNFLPLVELRSDHIFLDAPTVRAARAFGGAQPIFTYFVNELRVGSNSTPYSMVTATAAPMMPEIIPAGMANDEILINQWLADDLQAKPGDPLQLTYFVIGVSRKLEERTNVFRVRKVVPMTAPWLDPELMPAFPGLADAENCRDWKTGFPIDLGKIREKDEKYWAAYRGTPKAFVTLAAGQSMWTNRFGELTSIRFMPRSEGFRIGTLSTLLSHLDPATSGLSFQPLREQAQRASEQSMDFAGLFLGFSFFLIVAALLLIALLFQFSVEQRSEQTGTLLALGFTARQVRRVMLAEGVVLGLLGAILGLPAGMLYAKAMLWGLTTVWKNAVGTGALDYHARPETFIISAAAGVVISAFTIWLALRAQTRKPARELLARAQESELGDPRGRKPILALATGIGAGLLALGLLGFSLFGSEKSPDLFFSSGALALIASLALLAAFLKAIRGSRAAAALNLGALGLRNCSRQRRRSLATIAMFACGTFLIASIGIFHRDARQENGKDSGTGGFQLLAECALPVTQDLNAAGGREFFSFSPSAPAFSVAPFRLRPGDDASCLNLNRAQRPRVLGVRPELLAGRFKFAEAAKGLDLREGWKLLGQKSADGAIPAIGDKASITWALGKKIGDTLAYEDDQGRTFQIRLVAAVADSILQGSLVISEENFIRKFSQETGHRIFLVEAAPKDAAGVAREMTKALQGVGAEIITTETRLAALNAVQNTYLATFQVLGGLGLLLGSAGLGAVVLRNVLERRRELALLRAVGFRQSQIRLLMLAEHGGLLLAGLISGLAAALLAVLPTLLASHAALPYRSLGWTLALIFFSGFLWTWLATLAALRGPLLDALRTE